MMDRLVTVKEMKERYQCSNQTARRYLRRCDPHLENPLAAPEWAVKEWEDKRTVVSARASKPSHRRNTGRIIVPRKR